MNIVSAVVETKQFEELFHNVKLHTCGANMLLAPTFSTLETQPTSMPVIVQCHDLGIIRTSAFHPTAVHC